MYRKIESRRDCWTIWRWYWWNLLQNPPRGLRTKGTEKVHQPTEKTESTAAGAEVKAAGGYAGGDEPGERQEVAKWKNILDEWKEYREKGGPKKERDEEFVDYISKKYPEFHFSVRILQRQAQALREKGEAALIDRRGKHKNHHRAIPPEVFDIFSSYYRMTPRKRCQVICG